MIVDLLFISFIVYGYYLGYRNEPLNKIFRLLPFLMALLAGVYLGPLLYDKMASLWSSEGVLMFLITFLICCFLGWSFSNYLADMFTAWAKKIKIKRSEKILNGITLAWVFLILLSGIISFSSKMQMFSKHTEETSLSFNLLHSLPDSVKKSMQRFQPGFQEFYEKSNKVLDNKTNE